MKDSVASPVYDRAIEFLKTRTNYEQIDRRGATLDLSPIRMLLERLGRPDRSLSFIHIAGTKGKGSTTWFVDAFLRRMGVKTGRYISPHLQQLEERVAVDGRSIDRDAFAEAILRVEPLAAEAKATFFDILTAAAILCFHKSGVAIVVLETGLGGRLDSTNGVETKISTAVTALGLEHTEILGPTIVDIAREKGAIARRGVPLFSVTNPDSPPGRAIAQIARDAGAPLFVMGREFHVRAARRAGPGYSVDVETVRRYYLNIQLPSPAKYQIENVALAAAIVDDLDARGLVPDARTAIERPAEMYRNDLNVPGRFEVLDGSPRIILDGAHTFESLNLLFDSVAESFQERPRIVVFGASKDKNTQRLFAALAGKVDLCLVTKARTPRAAEPSELLAAARAHGITARETDTVAGALDEARAAAGRTGLILATGSLYLVGEARTILLAGGAAGAALE